MIYQGTEKQVRQDRPRKRRGLRPAVLTIVAPLFWLALLAACSSRGETVETPAEGRKAPSPLERAKSRLPEQAVKDTAWDPAWPPLPSAGTPAQPIEQVRAMYAFAARRPEVLEYAPCYCGCESGGHESVRDCFVKGRDATGKPLWDGMGFS